MTNFARITSTMSRRECCQIEGARADSCSQSQLGPLTDKLQQPAAANQIDAVVASWRAARTVSSALFTTCQSILSYVSAAI